jgi:diaminopimelate decarboxylase
MEDHIFPRINPDRESTHPDIHSQKQEEKFPIGNAKQDENFPIGIDGLGITLPIRER